MFGPSEIEIPPDTSPRWPWPVEAEAKRLRAAAKRLREGAAKAQALRWRGQADAKVGYLPTPGGVPVLVGPDGARDIAASLEEYADALDQNSDSERGE